MKTTEKKLTNNKTKDRGGSKRTGKTILPQTQTILKQPNAVTMMEQDYSLFQMRAFMALIESLQPQINATIKNVPVEQLKLFDDENCIIQRNINQKTKEENIEYILEINIPLKRFEVDPATYPMLKEALVKLATTPIAFDTFSLKSGEAVTRIEGLCKVDIPKSHSRYITILINRNIAKRLVNSQAGFTKYLKEVVVKAKSKYTVKMYILISSWKDKGGFSMTMKNFRKYFGIENKYARYNNLYMRVLKPAYEELFEKSDCWFEFTEVYKDDNTSEPHRLDFKVIKSHLTKKEKDTLENTIRQIKDLFSYHVGVDERELRQVMELINLSNCQIALNKTIEVVGYMRKNRTTINNVNQYAIKTMTNILSEEDRSI